MRRRIDPKQTEMGMYIHGFGGSWLDHPFWRTQFLIRTQDQLDRVLRSAVPYVTIDDELGVGPADKALTPASMPAPHPPPRSRRLGKPVAPPPPPPPRRGISLERRRRQQVTRMVASSRQAMRGLFEEARLGQITRLAETRQIIGDITEAVEHSPGALLDIVRLKNKDEYTYAHSVAVCALMINVARLNGCTAREVRDYGQAGLLHDLGKIGIPDDILVKPDRLTEAEYRVVREHPEAGFNLLRESGDICALAMDVCRHHHERQDGTGYPFGLAAGAISTAAALGAICDVYDALTSDRYYKQAWAPGEALAAMWSWQGHFDRALLFRFMQSIDVFPEGMLVELRSNRLGVVKPARRGDSGPRVAAFYSTRERDFVALDNIYLAHGTGRDAITGPADPEQWGLAGWAELREQVMCARSGTSALRFKAWSGSVDQV